MPQVTPSPLHDVTVIIVAASALLGIGLGRVPGARLNRAAVAVTGAGLMLALQGGRLSFLLGAINGRVLVLLFALMVVNAALADAGVFQWIAHVVAARRMGPTALLVAVVAAAGTLSAFFLNDAVVLMLTAPVIALARRLGASPLPYLLALALAANAGSVAAVTGNPQNVVVAVADGIGYGHFASILAPVAAASLVVVATLVRIVFHREFRRKGIGEPLGPGPEIRTGHLVPAVTATAGMLVAFVIGAPVTTSAVLTATLLLVASGRRAGKIVGAVDVQLLVLFAGLFVIVEGLATTPAATAALAWAEHTGPLGLTAVVALASNLISNVPAVLLFLPAARATSPDPSAGLTLAMASTLAGNLTLVGSIANLIVAENARRLGVEIGFLRHARVGVPVALITLALGVAWLALG